MAEQRTGQPDTLKLATLVPYTVYPAKMGGQKGIALFYQYLSDILPLTMITTGDNRFPSDTGIRYVPALGSSRIRYINPVLYFTLKKLIRKEGITHLIIEHPYYGWLGLLLKRTTGIRLITHSHNIESLRFRSTGKWWWRILRHYEKWVHRLSDSSFFKTAEDMNYAIRKYKVDPSRCHVITYGIEIASLPAEEERKKSRKILEEKYGIRPGEMIMLFNGTLDYKPNADALGSILEKINPRLLKEPGFPYRILVCGKNLPGRFQPDVHGFLAENVQYAGFVDDIRVFFLGADLFLNPVTDGGGIKTKLVEALGFNLGAVSSRNGAIGVDPGLSPGKLTVVDNDDWDGFTRAVRTMNLSENTAPAFYNHFYWANIADKAKNILRT